MLKAKLACHPARCLLPVEIIERCSLATGPATVELLPYLLYIDQINSNATGLSITYFTTVTRQHNH